MPIETPFRNIVDLQTALTDLLHDIDDIRVHDRPSHFFLADAPMLENWSFAALFSPCLIGEVTGHPLLGDRPSIHTSQLMVLDTERGWARTWSRFYRLGAPHRRDQGH